jgi:hypothetical protein
MNERVDVPLSCVERTLLSAAFDFPFETWGIPHREGHDFQSWRKDSRNIAASAAEVALLGAMHR